MRPTEEQLTAIAAQVAAVMPEYVMLLSASDIERMATEYVHQYMPLTMLDPDISVVTVATYDGRAHKVRVELLVEEKSHGTFDRQQEEQD